MRQWRDAARTGEGPAMGRGRGSGASWGQGDPSGGGRPRGSGASWGAPPPNDWDEQGYPGYDEPPAARSSNRNRRQPPADYEEVDLERALVPTRGDLMPMDPSAGGAGVPALPGMPTTDEEERALGIRRPAYIPATGERRGRKLGTWRVVSGVLSVMLVCVASCGIAGLLGHNVLDGFLPRPINSTVTPLGGALCSVPATPVSTPGQSKKYVTGAITTTYVTNKGDAVEPTTTFPVGTFVYVLAMVRNIPNNQSHVISVRWYLDNAYIGDIPGANTSKTINGNFNVDFGLTYGQPGCGTARIYVDRPASDTSDSPTDSTLAQTVLFKIVQPTGTVTPGAGTPGAGTPGSGTPHASIGTPISAPLVAWRDDLAAG